ncbi:MAG: beta-N-acetylglucosaminidase domain-containing protein, partial [Armatimonadetes bacterium]|nr:beta-N-acetylglucosaminidase domain-containing protein [Armatimonadota bacterium]
ALVDWTPTNRYFEGQAGPVADVAHSGERSGMVRAIRYQPPEDARGSWSIALHSAWFDAPAPNSTIRVGGWIKARDVVSPGKWYRIRYTAYFFDRTGTKKIRHRDIACTDGTFDWRRFSADLIVPAGAERMKLVCQLTACTGTAWFDDLSVTVVQPALTVRGVLDALEFPDEPVVLPQPWRARYAEPVPLGEVALKVSDGDGRLERAARTVLERTGVTVVEDIAPGASRLVLGGPELAPELVGVLGDVTMTELGDEGYCLQVTLERGGTVVRIAANADAGRYWGLQTLYWLIVSDGTGTQVWRAAVVDRPTISRRGMAMGSQWFAGRKEAVERLSGLKCNFIWNQGSFMGGKFGGNFSDGARWREPLTDGEKQVLADYLALCREHFIEPAISMAPRGDPPTVYSSDTDINLVVDKLAGLYEIGFRELGLSFDDLRNIGQDVLSDPADVEAFGSDLGAAHLYFCREVYDRLKARCPEVVFRVLPWKYSGFVNLNEDGRRYLRTLGQLPAEVGMVVCANDPDNLATFTELTGRRPIIWDNWFAHWERGGSPPFVPPLDRTGSMSDTRVEGYIFLPMIPWYEDAAGTSWLTAADYMWSPERCDAAQAFARAVRAAMGDAAGAAVFREAGTLLEELALDPPDAAGAPAAVERLQALLPRLREALPARTLACVERQFVRHIKALESNR